MNEALVTETLTLLCASALGIALVSRFGLPAMLGYLPLRASWSGRSAWAWSQQATARIFSPNSD
jgi:hypothetical protein